MQYMYQSRCLGSASLRRTVKWLLLLGRVKGVIYMCKFLPYRYRGTLSVWNPVSTAPPSPPHLEWVRGEFHGTFRKKRLVCVCVGVVGKRKTDATIGLNGWGREGNKTKHGTISSPFFLLSPSSGEDGALSLSVLIVPCPPDPQDGQDEEVGGGGEGSLDVYSL